MRQRLKNQTFSGEGHSPRHKPLPTGWEHLLLTLHSFVPSAKTPGRVTLSLWLTFKTSPSYLYGSVPILLWEHGRKWGAHEKIFWRFAPNMLCPTFWNAFYTLLISGNELGNAVQKHPYNDIFLLIIHLSQNVDRNRSWPSNDRDPCLRSLPK